MKRVVIVLIIMNFGSAVRGQISDFHNINFCKTDSVAALYPAHSLKDLKGLADLLTQSLQTEPEKFRAIFKWVCSNVEVDYELVTANKRKRANLHGDQLARWNRTFNAKVFNTLLQERKTICSGYAYLIRELSFHAGLASEIVNGYAKPGGIDTSESRTVNHSWNSIRLNNKWYVCDATWSSGIFDLSTGQFRKKNDDRYFLTDPAKFSQNHHSPDFRLNISDLKFSHSKQTNLKFEIFRFQNYLFAFKRGHGIHQR